MRGKNMVVTLSAPFEYWLKLPPKEVLQAKWHKAIEEAELNQRIIANLAKIKLKAE